MEDEKKPRSPAFPFISLEKALQRAGEFEKEYGQQSGRAANVVKVWGYAEKSSGGQQTIGALSQFGLLDDSGSNETRKLKLTSLALTILKDKRPGFREQALKQAALKPKIIADLWSEWGTQRPPDDECISVLHLERRYLEDAASRLLRIYDDTIKFADLAGSDKPSDNTGEPEANVAEADSRENPPPPRKKHEVPMMANERVVFAHEIRPNQGFRIVVTGEVDSDMVAAMAAYAKFQEMLVKNAPPKADDDTKQ